MKEKQQIKDMSEYLEVVVTVLVLESKRLEHIAKLYDLTHQLQDKQKISEVIKEIHTSANNLLVRAVNINEYLDNPPSYTIH